MTPDEFYARVVATLDAQGRLPKPPQAGWDIFPFEYESVVPKTFEAPVLPEPPRSGEDPATCWNCQNPDASAVWQNDRWTLAGLGEPVGLPFVALLRPREHYDLGDLDPDMAAELGQLLVRLDVAVRSLGNIGRVHVNKWGDGGAHLHVFVLARPEGLLQMRGSNLALWEEMLPRVPQDETAAALDHVARRLASVDGHVLT